MTYQLFVCPCGSKSRLAAAIHKKVNIYEISDTSNTPVRRRALLMVISRLYQPLQVMVLEGHTGNVTAVSFHLEGKWLVTGSEDGTIKIWDLRSNKLAFFK